MQFYSQNKILKPQGIWNLGILKKDYLNNKCLFKIKKKEMIKLVFPDEWKAEVRKALGTPAVGAMHFLLFFFFLVWTRLLDQLRDREKTTLEFSSRVKWLWHVFFSSSSYGHWYKREAQVDVLILKPSLGQRLSLKFWCLATFPSVSSHGKLKQRLKYSVKSFFCCFPLVQDVALALFENSSSEKKKLFVRSVGGIVTVN